jgi:hypothetical protein
MGFDIYAIDEEGNEVAYLRAYMGAFRMCREQGYDWFKLIDAEECDGGVSGTGESKRISLRNLEKALEVLKEHDPKGKLSGEGRDEWSYRKPLLKGFMDKCVEYCLKNDKKSILIKFL